jgi:hypothetical protein
MVALSVNPDLGYVKLFLLVVRIWCMQGAVLRDTNPRRRRNRLVTVLLLPVFAVMWLVGWTLTWVGSRKDEGQPKPARERRADHVKLFSANTVLQDEDEEEEERVEIVAVD